jgi:transposase InsO family protein
LEEDWSLNRKRTQRLWREEGLRLPARRRKRRRLGVSTVPATRLAAERPDHVSALDFQLDQTADGHILKLLHVVDEFDARRVGRSSVAGGSTPIGRSLRSTAWSLSAAARPSTSAATTARS